MMFWDDLVRRWRRDNRTTSGETLRAAAGNVAVLPAPRYQRRPRWILLIVAVALLGLGVYLASIQSSQQTGQPNAPVVTPASR